MTLVILYLNLLNLISFDIKNDITFLHISYYNMPRKKIVKDTPPSNKPSVDELLNNKTEEHVIMQLPLNDSSINNIIKNQSQVASSEPIAYQPHDFTQHSEIICDDFVESKRSVCFWCCHDLVDFSCGMPLKYSSSLNHFDVYGTFCSFQCASAFNFSINSKSDKVWDINALINMMASKYGINENIKPAPSRYVLQMFGGDMNIEDFRNIHKESERSLVLNIPPMTSITASTELLNTSYINYDTKNNIETKLQKK